MLQKLLYRSLRPSNHKVIHPIRVYPYLFYAKVIHCDLYPWPSVFIHSIRD